MKKFIQFYYFKIILKHLFKICFKFFSLFLIGITTNSYIFYFIIKKIYQIKTVGIIIHFFNLKMRF